MFKFLEGDKKYKEVYKKLILRYKDNVLLQFGEKPAFMIKHKEQKREEFLSFLKEILDYLNKK